MQRLLVFSCFMLMFLGSNEGTPVPKQDETEIKHFWHGRCQTHRECGCLTGLPICHEGFCHCVYGGIHQYGNTAEIVDTETTTNTDI